MLLVAPKWPFRGHPIIRIAARQLLENNIHEPPRRAPAGILANHDAQMAQVLFGFRALYLNLYTCKPYHLSSVPSGG